MKKDVDRLEKGGIPICVASCPLRAFIFGTLQEIKAKNVSLCQLESMSEPIITKPNFIAKENVPAVEKREIDRSWLKNETRQYEHSAFGNTQRYRLNIILAIQVAV